MSEGITIWCPEAMGKSEDLLRTCRVGGPDGPTVWEHLRGEASADGTLERAKGLVAGERQQMYGPPGRAMGCVALAWRAYWAAKGLTVPFTAKDVAQMMAGLKFIRSATDPGPDSNIDAAGYHGIAGDMEEK